MSTLVRSWRRFVFRVRREELERELAEELAIHREMRIAANEQYGLDAPGAREVCRKQLGNVTSAKEQCREEWSFMTLERLLQDTKHAARMFGRTPVFTSVAILSLALGIGGNAAMFSLVNALLIQPLPYPQSERLVRISGTYPRAAVPYYQQRSRTMEVAAVSPGNEMNVTERGWAMRSVGSVVSANFFAVMGSSAERGRLFHAGEDRPRADSSVVISDRFWHDRFLADPNVIGKLITIGGRDREIVGVMPESFNYPSSRVQFWMPMRLDQSNFVEYWGGEFVPFVARLRPNISLPAAHLEARSLVAEFRKTFPYPMSRDWNADVSAIPLKRDIVGDTRSKLFILFASVAVVLLIAAANLASLMLARATTRRREMAIRTAVGAGRARMMRQLLTESVFLSLCGAAAGLLLGMAALSIFKGVVPASMPGLAEAHIDWQVAAATGLLAILVGMAFGLAPALSTSQVDLTETIKTGSQRSTTGGWTTLRKALVGCEVALSLVLVVSAGLLLQSMLKLASTNPGFDPASLVSIRVSPDRTVCNNRAACVAFYDRLLDQVAKIRGVRKVEATNVVPLDGQISTLPVDIESHPKTPEHPAPVLFASAVTPGYLSLLDIPLIEGRTLTRADAANSSRVIVVSAAVAKYFWPRESAVGKHIRPAGAEVWQTIVGVVGDVKQYSLSAGLPEWIPGAVYVPYGQAVQEDGQVPVAMSLVVASDADSPEFEAELRQIVQRQDPRVPVGRVERIAEVVAGSMAGTRATMKLFGAFAFTAIVLAAIGIYGLMAYWVTQRTYEIGLRVAIGATRKRIVGMILGEGLRVAAGGVIAGVVISLMVTRFLRSLLYQIGTTDMVTFLAVTLGVTAVAVLASAAPAWRASQIDPAKSLRLD